MWGQKVWVQILAYHFLAVLPTSKSENLSELQSPLLQNEDTDSKYKLYNLYHIVIRMK